MEPLLALFPLNTVLFPGATLSLHIFEPRYRQMINRCVQLKQPFGVVLIRQGDEVASAEHPEPVEPYEIGTTAIIQQVLKWPDGRMLLSAQGGERFRITRIVQHEPYLVAEVEAIPDEVTPEAIAITEEVRTLYVKHRDAIAHATGVAQDMAELPDDPVGVSFELSDRFRVVNDSKQQLLEAELDDRLAAIVEALNHELRLLPRVTTTPPRTYEGQWTLN